MMYESETFEKTGWLAGPARRAMKAGMSVRLRLAGMTGKLARCITRRFFLRRGGFGMNELLGIAAALIIAAFIVIPGLKELANSLIDKLKEWWDTITEEIFSTSP
jgi:predicted PurR-regulated permease PerM